MSTDTRAALLEAAQALFLEQGFDATAMDQVRQRAGASNGSLYHHFPTKGHLARALYEGALQEYHAALLAALEGAASAEEGIRGLVAAHIAWVVRQPRQARVLHDLRRTTAIAGAEPDWGALNAEAFATLRGWCDARARAGDLLALPFGVVLALVFAPVLQLTPHWLRAARPQVPSRLREVLAEAAWRAVAPRKEPT